MNDIQSSASELQQKIKTVETQIVAKNDELKQCYSTQLTLSAHVDEGFFHKIACIFSKEKEEESNKLKEDILVCKQQIRNLESNILDLTKEKNAHSSQMKEYKLEYQRTVADKELVKQEIDLSSTLLSKYTAELKIEQEAYLFIMSKLNRQIQYLKNATGNLKIQVLLLH